MKKLKKIFSFLGPGFITGAADDDPSGIATYSQTGSIFGLKQLWTAPYSLPFMYTIQEMCGRIGMVTGKGLAGVIKKYYKAWVLYLSVSLLLIANVINISTDLGAMAASLELILGLPFSVWILLVTFVTLLLEVFVSYKVYSKYLKYLSLFLLFYIPAAFFIKIDVTKAFTHTLIPHFEFDKDFILNIVAVLGTTISPYLFFWQSYEEVEEEVEVGKLRTMGKGIPRVYRTDLQRLKKDTAFGMFFSTLVMWFIILVCGTTLYNLGIHEITTAHDAALALRPIAGDFSFLLFTLGIVGTGLLTVPILAGSASYALSETLGLKVGLYKKLKDAHGFYGVITLAMLAGLIINFTGIPVMEALYYTAVLNGVIAPPLIFIILAISNNKNIMQGRTNRRMSNVLGITIAVVMSLASIIMLLSLLGVIF